MAGRIEIFYGGTRFSRQRWFWRVKAGNNKVVASGAEGYLTRWNAKRAATKQHPGLPVHNV